MTTDPGQVTAQLRSGEWLSRGRLRLYATILLVIEIAVFGFLVSVALAVMSYHFFEAPILTLKRRFA